MTTTTHLVRCELVNAPAHEGIHAELPNCRHPLAELHTCPQGPICAQMTRYLDVMSAYADDPISREYGIYPAEPADVTECEHLTCLAIVYAPCYLCQIETMNEVHELLAGDPWTQHRPTEEGTQS
jgi:hypothetical protein